MTNEEEKLLLKDLAARVPYGVMVEQTLFSSDLADKEQRLKSVQANNCVKLYWYEYIDEFVPIDYIKPYLRPLSSMTEEEKEELYQKTGFRVDDCILGLSAIDWLIANHFDFRGLIPMGLALEAPNRMYKTE